MLCFMILEGSPRYRGGSCAICTGLATASSSCKIEKKIVATIVSRMSMYTTPFLQSTQ